MWIVLFDFFLGLLLLGFLLYGLQRWDTLLTDEDRAPEAPAGKEEPVDPPGRFLAVWVLLLGLGGYSLLEHLFGGATSGMLP